MKKSEIIQTILSAIEMANHGRESDAQIPVKEDTLLYGEKGHLDSMGLVSFLIDIEESLMDKDIQINLSDEKAMSQSRSPFRSVSTLADYIESLVNS
jgi:acyl carrier protein